MAGLLEQKAAEIYALQGGDSHELPYPAPQYWTESEGNLFSDPKIHIRPPFTHGECEIASGCSWDGEDDSTNRAMELGGFDGEYANELNQYVTDQTERHYTRLKAEDPEADESALRQEAERLAEQDGNDRAAQDYEESDQDYQARATEQNDTVLARWEDAETAGSEFSPTVEPSRDTTFRESSGDLDTSGYSPPSGGDFNGSPSGSGTTGLNNPDSTGGFGGSGGLGGNGGGSSLDTGSSGLDSDNPWGSYAGEDPDDVGGGLASGTGGGTLAPAGAGASTGLGTGAGAGGVGTGAGASTGLFGSPSGGAGAGRGMAAGAGKGGMGAGRGASSSMMGGGRGAGGRGPEDQEGRETWLTEDEDVWGLHFDPENDPYV
ncbi:hypothetical protein [Glycomyces salinus]|uniref:hypothetical protein n=1 Tax=Glycomyces salinus TaxID=980294 RepID=UPI0018EE0A28|nr:hypothetical protein [Glycomyces salinus]